MLQKLWHVMWPPLNILESFQQEIIKLYLLGYKKIEKIGKVFMSFQLFFLSPLLVTAQS